MAGLDATGLTIKRLDEIRDDLVAAFQSSPEYGASTNTGPDSPIGQAIDVIAAQLSELWELAQEIYDAWDPDAAEGIQLDNIAGLTGVVREPANFSQIPEVAGAGVIWSGTPATLIPAGTIARVGSDGAEFSSDTATTIGGGGTAPAVSATATTTGPNEAAIGALDTLVTVIPGLTGVTNTTEAILGQDIETDPELRRRREESFSLGGHGTDGAIQSRVAQLDDVQTARVKSNRTNTTDADGLPPHSFRTVIWPAGLAPAIEQEIAGLIFLEMPAGILADGTEAFTVTDNQGTAVPVAFSYATGIEMYVEVDVTAGAEYPGDSFVDDAVNDFGDTLTVGDDVLPYELGCYILDNVNGIEHLVIRVQRGAGPGPTDTIPVVIDFDEIALFDSARNTIAS